MSKRGIVFDKNDPKSVSMTEQAHENECDINKIVARAEKGIFPIGNAFSPIFGDFMDVDLTKMLETTNRARTAFMTLKPEIRARFENDPAKVVEFLHDEKNADEARKLGLLPPLTPEQVKALNEAAEAKAKAGAAPAAS